MKKTIVFALLLALALSGCASDAPLPETADFSFTMPDRYSVGYEENLHCTILRDQDCVAVGGMEVVPLARRALTEKHTTNILEYLQNTFHQTNNVEFIASQWSKESPVVTVEMRVHRDTGEENHYSHYFFEKDSLIYHIWLDQDLLGETEPGDFLTCVIS